MGESLTSSLRQEIEKTNNSLTRWANTKLSQLSSSVTAYKRQEEECIFTINALSDNDRQLTQYKIINDNIRRQQQEEIKRYIQQIEKLEAQKTPLTNQLRKLEEDEHLELQKLDKAMEQYQSDKDKLERSKVQDMSKGVQLYLNLGLEFQKAPNDCMKFIFTQIDSKNPSKEFFFAIFVDGNDKYQFVESSPSLNKDAVNRLVHKLNSDSDISYFVVSMRKAFKALVS